MPCAMRGQMLLNLADIRYLLQVGIHLRIRRDGQQLARARQLASSRYFSSRAAACGSTGTQLITEVFSRGLWIHSCPSSSVVKCSRRRWSTSVKANPVSAQKQKTSRMRSKRSLGIGRFNSRSYSAFVNGTLTFVLSIFIL